MAKFTKWLLEHKVIILCVIVLLMALSVVGWIFTEKESDVLSYLDEDSNTVIGKQYLAEQYGIVGDTTFGISYLGRDDVQTIVDYINTDTELINIEVEGKNLLAKVHLSYGRKYRCLFGRAGRECRFCYLW